MRKYTYKIVASQKGNSELPYITQTRLKHFNNAINWCMENNWYSCKVNNLYYTFDFDKLEVSIGTNGSQTRYKIIRVSI